MDAPNSYSRGDDAEVPALDIRFDELLAAAVESVPDREALVFVGGSGRAESLVYRELEEAVDRAAAALVGDGIMRGSRVAVYAANRPEFVILQFACSRIGASVVPVNPLYRGDELRYVLARSGAELCFVDPGHSSDVLVSNVTSLLDELPHLRRVVTLSTARAAHPAWDEWIKSSGELVKASTLDQACAAARPSDVVQIQFTSGTTGRPKAVQLTSSALANGGRCTAHRAGLEDGCRYAHAMPFFHVGGTVTAMATCLAKAGTHIFLPTFSPSGLAAAVERERATALLAVPTMLISLADQAAADNRTFETLRTVLTGGALVPAAVAARWIDGYGAGISNTYGMTEIAGPAIQTSPNDPRDRALESVGRPLPGVEVEIVEVGTDVRVPVGAEGEIRMRGWGVMQGYLGDPEATAAAVDEEGWLRSGDLGVLDADGFVRVTGRVKDLIIRGGENIAPATVEDAIREHVPEVVDVCVVGVPDAYYGEAVAACVRLRDGAALTLEQLQTSLEGKVPSFRMPAHLMVLDAFPTTASGKVQKFRLAESLARRCGTLP